MSVANLEWWNSLRHSGLLLDRKRLEALYPEPITGFDPLVVEGLREARELGHSSSRGSLDLVDFVLCEVCGFAEGWKKGSQIDSSWTRRDREGNAVRPDRLWFGPHGALLPVFVDKDSKRVGIGKGRKTVSQVLRWLRAGSEKLAVLTNGRQWRLLYAGLDYDAWCESDGDLWFEDGEPSPQLHSLASLLSPRVWSPEKEGAKTPLLDAIEESRKGQADLSASLGERVRLAVEKLLDAHQLALDEHGAEIPPAELYRAAVRIVMRLVVVLFAEARGLLPVDNPVYHSSYGLRGLQEDLRKLQRTHRLGDSRSAWPRLLALFRLVYGGSAHPDLPVRGYGGELFQPGSKDSDDGLRRGVWIFENACYTDENHGVADTMVDWLLTHLTRTTERIRSGRGTIAVPVPVDFSDLSSEYIGILYEGLLDYELKAVPRDEAVVILPVGHNPALPLSRLEAMEDRQLADLVAKFAKENKSSGKEDEAEEADSEPEDEDTDTADTDEEGDSSRGEASDLGRRVTALLQRLIEQGKLVKKPRGRMTPEKKAAYEGQIERRALSLAKEVHYPGKRYLVRWGGTRKGSGTFYTRPGLAGPLVHRTLAPLAYIAPTDADGAENRDAPLAEWTPRKPEEVLALKICDPACGSGTFPVGVLRFLTRALWDAVHHHGRVTGTGDNRTAVSLFGNSEVGESLADEYLPCLPDDESYEARLLGRLKRHVAERCIYGVELDPLAVELCRLALWIETLDPELPFTFLNHKIKCGNSLVGCWFDRYQHYPDKAFRRAAGDDGHSTSVNYPAGVNTRAIATFLRDIVRPDLASATDPQLDLFRDIAAEKPAEIHQRVRQKLVDLHALGVHDVEERSQNYSELVLDPEFVELKKRFDLWCALWFWPAERLDLAPLPTSFGKPTESALHISDAITAEQEFFHWELEFPDVFNSAGAGFDAVLGNPPWDTLQPNSKEYFSEIDPLYRTYDRQHALSVQKDLFVDPQTESDWLSYKDYFKNYANWLTFAGDPFSAPPSNISKSYCDRRHPFLYQGTGKPYTYKMFTELAYALLKGSGYLGFIVPSGIYSDHGTRPLRDHLISSGNLMWIFGFENFFKIFDIHREYKFNPIIVQKGGATLSVLCSFMQRDLDTWGHAEQFATPYPVDRITQFSPSAHALIEATSSEDLRIAEKMYGNAVLLGSLTQEPWNVKFAQGNLNITSARRRLKSVAKLKAEGAEVDSRGGLATTGAGEKTEAYLPVYEGKLIWQHDPAYVAPQSPGSSKWEYLPWPRKRLYARYYQHTKYYSGDSFGKLVMRDVSNPKNQRTFIAAVVPDFPCGHKVPILAVGGEDPRGILILSTVLNSLAFDFMTRMRFAPSGGGGSLIWSVVKELPVWDPEKVPANFRDAVAGVGAALTGGLPMFSRLYAKLTSAEQDFVAKSASRNAARERMRLRCISDALNARAFGLNTSDFLHVVDQCWHPAGSLAKNTFTRDLFPKLFWRVDKDKPPQLRHTILSLLALSDFIELEERHGDIGEAAIEFSGLGSDQGWQIPSHILAAKWASLGLPPSAVSGDLELLWDEAEDLNSDPDAAEAVVTT